MRRDGPDPADMPMPADVYAEHVQRRRQAPRPDPLHPVPRRDPAPETSPLAAEMLAEAVDRSLESGELLLVSEEATLADLETAAAAVAPAATLPALPPDEPVLTVLAAPRLLDPRVWEAFIWQPPLAEHLRLLEAALQAGRVLPQTMLVGHIETFPERVEHLARLRDMVAVTAAVGGRVVLAVRQAVAADLPSGLPSFASIMADARPGEPDIDRRHALALARLALGPRAVLSG